MKRTAVNFLAILICVMHTASILCAQQSAAVQPAPVAAPITPDVFIKLSPEEKVKQAPKMDPQALKVIVNSNLDILKKYKLCPNGYLENVTIENVDLSGANLFNTVFKNVVLNNVNLSKANFTAGVIIGSKFNNCNFSEMEGRGIMIAGLKSNAATVITKSNLTKTSLREARINADFINCNMDELQADGGTQINLSRFVNTTLKKANMQWVEINMVLFEHVDWTQADLRNALIVEADMSYNVLTQVHLENADIVYTNMFSIAADGASLQGTNFIYGVMLRGANFAKAVDSPQTNWAGAQFCDTLMFDKKIKDDNCGKQAVFHSWQRDVEIVARNKVRFLLTKSCAGGLDNLGCMLEEVDLRGKDLSGSDLTRAWMPQSDLRGTNFSGADLRRAFLKGSRVDAGTQFAGALFCRTYMPDGTVRNDHCSLTPGGAKPAKERAKEAAAGIAAETEKNKASLIATKACPGCNLAGISLAGADLSKANLANANLTKANLAGANLTQANLTGADLSQADMQGATLDGCDCSNATFKRTKMNNIKGDKVNFTDAVIFNATLEGANLHDATFVNANLSGSNFKKTVLDGVDFNNANPTNTQFDEATYCCVRIPDKKTDNITGKLLPPTINYQNCAATLSDRQKRSACKVRKPDWYQIEGK